MARSQALVHFIGRGLTPLDLGSQQISTPDYQALLDMNDMVRHDSWELFYDMQNNNPYTRKVRQILLTSLQKLHHGITKKN
jgi:prephenate dehydrogenase